MAFSIDKAAILDRMSPDGQKAALGEEILRLGREQTGILATLGEMISNLEGLVARVAGEQKYFARTATLEATGAGTRVRLLASEEIPAGKRAHPLGFQLLLSGETAWGGGTGASVMLVDTGTDEIYRFASIAASRLQPGAFLGPGSEGVTLDAEFGMNLGARAGKGIDVMADGDFAEGSDLCVTVFGYLG